MEREASIGKNYPQGNETRATVDNKSEKLRYFGVNERDLPYARALYDKYLNPERREGLRIGENFLPSAFLNENEKREILGVSDYAGEVKGREDYLKVGSDTILELHPLDAGNGSSIKRDRYLIDNWGLLGRTGEARIGAKGTDLFFNVSIDGSGRQIAATVNNLKNQRIIRESVNYKQVVLQPVANKDSIEALRESYLSLSLEARVRGGDKTFVQEFRGRGVVLESPIMQANLPNIDARSGELTDERMSPGSHGQIGSYVLNEISKNERGFEGNKVRAIYNGDGPNNFVSAEMVGFTVKEGAGIVMVTTTKTGSDLKGGLLGIELTRDKAGVLRVPQIMELAQAKKAGQEEEFYQIGLFETKKSGEQNFNTNTALFNEGKLAPFLNNLRRVVGEKVFSQAISPDLIENKKEQGGREFIQLEGALASVIFNLNKFVLTDERAKKLWGELSGDAPFLRIINLDARHRSEFFTPIKYPVDHAIYASDRYSVDIEKGMLVDNRPGHTIVLDEAYIKDPFYADMSNVGKVFAGVSLINCDRLGVSGNSN